MGSNLVTALMGLGPAVALSAAVIARPKGPVLLTLTGRITRRNFGHAAQFDAAALAGLDGRRIRGETAWTSGLSLFEGPCLRAVLEAAGARGRHLRLRTNAGETSEIRTADARRLDIILAMRMDGRFLQGSDKGPLVLVYPLGAKNSVSAIAQLHEIEVLE
jgi:hypothetical protein